MTTIKINGSKHTLPTCWDEVSYNQYVAMLSIYDDLPSFLSLFTGLSRQSLLDAHIDSVDDAWQALYFLNTPPEFKPRPTSKVGSYKLKDVIIKSLAQLDALRQLPKKAPSPPLTIEDNQIIADLYLEACAITMTKSKYGFYDESKVAELKEEIKAYSSVEVLQTGAFYLAWVIKAQQPQHLN